ncbi:MAG: esterase-like activity of phytase family protein [Geminicoccaceae bacterium]
MFHRRESNDLAAALAVLLLLAGCQPSRGADAGPSVRSSPVAPAEAEQLRRVGRLEFRAGFVLGSRDPGFGGLSGLWLAPDGKCLIAASDGGILWAAELAHAGDGTLLGFDAWHAIEPATAAGDPTDGKRDAEALAELGDDLAIAYEGAHRLRRVPRAAPDAAAVPLPTPTELAEPHNRGIEALVGLEGGALLAIAEGVRRPSGDLAAWLIQDGRIEALSYAPAAGFAPTGADRLDDTIYVLERRVTLAGLLARVVALDAGEIEPGARLAGRELAVLGPPALSDNFEGIAVRRGPDGGVLLYLVADDNFTALLRTVVIQFAFRPDTLAPLLVEPPLDHCS